MKKCPLCTIIEREKTLYEDDEIFLVSTKEMKGHICRVMCVIKRHAKEPTFIERTKAYAVIIDYMKKVMGSEKWFIVGDTFASILDHWHLMSSDTRGTPEELAQLEKTPKVEMSIYME